MNFHISDDEDDNMLMELDAEGIDYLIQGLLDLRDCAPDEEIRSPSLGSDENGNPESVGFLIMKRLADD